MILKGSQRAGARSLALHLLNDRSDGNDHVMVHELRGVAATHPWGAFHEMEAVSSGTHSTKPFFSCSFNPPKSANLTIDQFETAFMAVEQKMGLENQPRIVVFHEKQGRRHAHVCWSVIQSVKKTDKRFNEKTEVEKLAAIKLGMYKNKLKEVSRDLYLEFGLEMPEGYKDQGRPDPLNYDQITWQQAKRLNEDPRDLKALIRSTFQASDNTKAFSQALEQQGLFLARGDKRGFVVIHHSGELMALTRYSGYKAKELRERLGDPATLPTVDQAQSIRKERMSAALDQLKTDLRNKHRQEWQPFRREVHNLRMRQREERKTHLHTQQERTSQETLARAERLRKGIVGLWDRLTGHRGRTVQQNKQEVQECEKRDRQEQQIMIDRHVKERQGLQKDIDQMKEQHTGEREQLRMKMGFLFSMDSHGMRDTVKEHLRERDEKRQDQKDQDKGRERDRSRKTGPDEPGPT